MKINNIYTYSIFLFLISFISLFSTIKDYGFVYDDYWYILHTQKIEYWLKTLFSHPNKAFDLNFYKSIWEFDRFHQVHPPFYKLSAIFFKYIIGQFFFSKDLYLYRISTIFWFSLFLVFLFLYLNRIYNNKTISFFLSLSFLFIPRIFAWSHIFYTDIIVMSLSFMALYSFFFIKNDKISILLAGIFSGFLIDTKFSGFLIYPLIIFISFIRILFYKESLKFYLCKTIKIFLISALIFYIFNPGIWFDKENLLNFFKFSIDRKSHPFGILKVLYFGKIYPYSAPWHHPWVILSITFTEVIVIGFWSFAFLGIYKILFYKKDIINAIKNKENFSLIFEIIVFSLLIFIFMLPSTPKHEYRIYSQIWPFFFLLSYRGWGFFRISKSIISLIIFTFNLLITILYHPAELDYYNMFIGYTKGAFEHGFEVGRYFYPFNEKVVNLLNDLNKIRDVNLFNIEPYIIKKVYKVGGFKIEFNRNMDSFYQDYIFLKKNKNYNYNRELEKSNFLLYKANWILNDPKMKDYIIYILRQKPIYLLETPDKFVIMGIYERIY